MTDITADEYRTAAKVDRHHGGQSTAQFYEDNARALEADEAESFEFLNELALAFRAAENHPRPAYAPVLEGVRAVLTHLTSTGRLIPVGGRVLTAEQVEDVEALVATANPYSAPAARLRALFPATEPAEPAASEGVNCGANSVTLGWCKLTARHEGLHTNGTYLWGTPSEPDPPAPAEPAEEEAKAEVDGDFIEIVFDGPPEAVSGRFVEVENPQGASISVGEWIDRGDGFWALRIPYPSSPVVPAPTETEAGHA